MCIDPWIQCLEHPILFFKKLYEELRVELGNNHVYSLHFFTPIPYIHTLFKNYTNFSIFFIVLVHGSSARSTQNFILKKCMRTSLLIWGIIIYTHTIFLQPIFVCTDIFLEIVQFISFFSCIPYGSSARSTYIFFSQKGL